MSEIGLEYITGPAKRRFDKYGAISLIGLLSPVMAGTAVTAGIDSRTLTPVLRQTRAGQHGDDFDVFKFQTLREDRLTPGIQTFGTFDPRASRLGLLMRRYGIDELPQLANVVKGDMSLVGIRPLIRTDLNRLQDYAPDLFDDWYDAYNATKPGLTGPGQLHRHHFKNGQTSAVYRESMRIDLDYIAGASLRGDVAVLARCPLDLLLANLTVIDNTAEPAAAVAGRELVIAH